MEWNVVTCKDEVDIGDSDDGVRPEAKLELLYKIQGPTKRMPKRKNSSLFYIKHKA